jgi:2-polyprenyl-3-methyl-5-hydroxy-6-metoxy-1,4-benzoquinol methylase
MFVPSSKSAHNILDVSRMSSIARSLFKDGPVFQRTLQHWRPYICPFERLVGHVRDGSRVLDIGCGSGLLLGLMAGTGLEFEGVGIDVSPRAIEVATGMAHRVTKMKLKARLSFIQLDDGAHWPDGTFDAVFLVDVLHHISLNFQHDFFDQAISKVKDGGVLVYKDMCSQPWWRAQANRLHDLMIAQQLVTHVPIWRVEVWGRSHGMEVTWREDVTRLWYGHELMVMKRPIKC